MSLLSLEQRRRETDFGLGLLSVVARRRKVMATIATDVEKMSCCMFSKKRTRGDQSWHLIVIIGNHLLESLIYDFECSRS